MKSVLYLLILCFSINLFSQKKVLDHSDYDIWNTIQRETISPAGDFVMYSLEKGEKDQHTRIKDNKANLVFEHERSERGSFTYDGNYAIFTIKPWKDSIIEMKRRKVKKEKMPKDSIGIFNLKTKSLHKIGNIKSYQLPEKWSGYVAYTFQLEDKKKPDNTEKSKDSTQKDTTKTKKKPKVASDKTGYSLVIKNLKYSVEDTIHFVTNFCFAKEGRKLAYTTTGDEDDHNAGVFVLDLDNKITKQIFESHAKTKYAKLIFSDSGSQLGFVVDADTTKAFLRPNQVYTWNANNNQTELVVDNTSAPEGYRVSSDGSLSFSKDESRLYFGLALPHVVKDTTLLDEEIVNVEVWTYDEPRLYTVQEMQIENDQKKSFETVYHLNTKKLIQIASKAYPDARTANEGNGNFAFISNSKPYMLESQWTGKRASDVAIINVNTGEVKPAMKQFYGSVQMSPSGKYAFGYHPIDSTWYTYNLETSKYTELTKGKPFFDEMNDSPVEPRSYGSAGWTKNDASVILYDRYDLWEFHPETAVATKLTDGRPSKTSYRYVNLDPEQRYIDTSDKWLLTTFNETTKNSGYYEFNYKNKNGKQLLDGPYRYSNPQKARESGAVIFSRQSFQEFPNIRLSDLSFKKSTVISNANPQQANYNWGTAELVEWTSLDGIPLTGMLIKPENFDPNKKYPLLVNFYERSSDGLHNHRIPRAERSSINYSFYASRGYLIFNPDIHYRIGYPGESAFSCVMPGITSLIEKGFVDKDNIGTQGHSWGGYQIAYMVTKTDIFKAAESGAPVANMISAYGGIRWQTGLSRQFQYEHTQSRIGGTPWDYPQRYVENSPIFNIDKINTPLLIMHNDADGHVPWYQGIEFFTSLRRLGKPSWMLNYNGEPHWPLKMQNRKDFNIRMAQFFDHYLKAAPKPVWMESGVPAIEKGVNQGYELIDKE
ncbi:alpha/beta hydrolase family protein [Paucihalobacter sp.]|uniref:alpha/beta hydrolase family protein n=1 Tax=Paucihalobacter sp. TaxID=2850405 RepID=UPI002FE190C4